MCWWGTGEGCEGVLDRVCSSITAYRGPTTMPTNINMSEPTPNQAYCLCKKERPNKLNLPPRTPSRIRPLMKEARGIYRSRYKGQRFAESVKNGVTHNDKFIFILIGLL